MYYTIFVINYYGGNIMSAISKDTVIGQLLAMDQSYAAILMASGMGCVGCPSAQGETLEEAAFVHGMNVDELVAKLQEYEASKQQ
jgi:hybrid cluster-associated redox disulfide protein